MTVDVLFVCYGNICRSPLGEFILKDLVARMGLGDRFHIESCGTSRMHLGDPVDSRSREELAKHGISCAGKTSRTLTDQDYVDFDYILAMDRDNLAAIEWRCPEDVSCTISLLMDYADGGIVDDPYFTLDFDKAYRDIERGCRAFLSHLQDEGVI